MPNLAKELYVATEEGNNSKVDALVIEQVVLTNKQPDILVEGLVEMGLMLHIKSSPNEMMLAVLGDNNQVLAQSKFDMSKIGDFGKLFKSHLSNWEPVSNGKKIEVS